jgi:hypothetical protein
MAYNITLSNGEALVTVADGTVDVNFTSLSLIGKNFAGYGALMNENFVYLLENFANAAPPTNPVTGQLWYDSQNRVMKVQTANGTWKTISSATASPTSPPNPAIGDQWWDTTNEQLFIWTSLEWKLVGPLWSVTQGQTGAIPDVITDVLNIDHIVIKFYVNDVVVGLWSKDADFEANQSENIAGFDPMIQTGMTMANLSPLNNILHGTVDNALKLGGIPAANYLRNDLILDINQNVVTQVVHGPIAFENTDMALEIGGPVGVIDDNMYDIGGPTSRIKTIYASSFHGVASSAQYADLAERFAADADYPAGTVVALGGAKEITRVADELSDDVFGVISTNAAYLMNAGAGNNATHPPIAVSGRVPVQVIGKVKKGDRLVSAGNGMARAASKHEITPWNVIGRALADKTDSDIGTVEAIVKLSS